MYMYIYGIVKLKLLFRKYMPGGRRGRKIVPRPAVEGAGAGGPANKAASRGNATFRH